MRYRYLRLTARFFLLGLLLICLLVGLLLVYFLGTTSGREWAANRGLQAAQDAGVEISVDNLRSPGLGHWQVGHLALFRDGTPLLDITDLELRWSPRALFSQRLHVYQLTANTLDYYQLPATEEEPEPTPEDGPMELPSLWPVAIDHFAIGELGLHDLPLPEGAELPHYQLSGAAQLFEAQYPVRLELDLQSLPEGDTRLRIDTRALSLDEVQIQGSLVEPAGGLLGQLLNLPSDQALDAQFAIGLEQDEEVYYLSLDQLKLPLFAHQLGANGTIRLDPQRSSVQVRELILDIDGKRQRIRGAYSPDDLWAELILAELPLELAQMWLPELSAGHIGGRIDISWLHNEPDTLPKVDADTRFSVTYREQTLQADIKAQFAHPLVHIQRGVAEVENMTLDASGTLDLEGPGNQLEVTLVNLNSALLANWPEVPLPETLKVSAERLQLSLTGALTDPDVTLNTHARGEYQQAPFDILVDAQANQRRARVAQLRAQVDGAQLNAQGLLDWTGDQTAIDTEFSRLQNTLLRFVPDEIDIPYPEELTFDASGSLRITGPLTSPNIDTRSEVAGTYALQEQTLPYLLVTHGSIQVGAPKDLALNLEQMVLSVLDKPVLEVEGTYASELADLRLRMSQLPTQILSALGWQDITGEAEADLHLQGSLQAPVLEGFFEYRDKLLLASGRTQVPVHLRADLSTQDGLLHMDTVFNQDQERVGQLRLQLPLGEYLDAPEDAPLPLNLDAVGNMDLGIVRLFLDPNQHNIGGNISMDFALRGHIEEPEFNGRLQLHDGAYTNPVTGTRLRSINVTLLGDGTQVRIEEAVARGGNGGSLTLTGAVDWAQAMQQNRDAIQLTLVARNAELVQRRDVQGHLQGEVNLRGSMEELWLDGDLSVVPLNINLDAAIRTTIPEIEVTEIDEDESVPRATGQALPTIHLDLVIRADQQAYLRGRGLDTELSGRINIGGTVETPDITGRFVTRRGRMELLGKTFILESGEVRFSNDIVSLRIPGVHTTRDFEFRIEVFGTADAPEIRLSSTPPLPEDEILSRLLFGRSIQEITAFQAIRLAGAVNSLRSGGGFDPMDTARDALGVDTLTIDTEPTEGGEGSEVSVGVGKYINERVYLEVKRTTNPAQAWQGSVQVELTPRIRLEGGTGETGGGRGEILWKRDY